MANLDFYVDFNVEVPNMEDEFTREAERRLRELAAEHSDMVGAAVSLESIVEVEAPYLYQVRIVVYKRPEDVAVIEKDAKPMIALHHALDALEEKVRESRERLSQTSDHLPDDIQTVVYELTPEEVYSTYARGEDPEEILRKSRTEIATKLMVDEGLAQDAAYFAADQIQSVAVQRVDEQNES